MGSSSRAIVITNSGTNELKLIERPTPRPHRGEVLVNVRGASLNFRDSEIIRGAYHTRYQLPLVPLSDAAGTVVAVGDGVTRARVGDRVAPTFWRDWIAGDSAAALVDTTLGGPLDGVLAEDVVLDEQRIVHVPRHLSDVEAATLPCAGLTAWHALVTVGDLRPGDTVLIQGTGGVAIFALQFALMMNAIAIVMSSSDAKLARAREMGAVYTLNYVETPEWQDQVLDLTNGRGVDHVVEVGGPRSFARSIQAARIGGQVHVIGYLGGTSGEINPLDIFRRRLRVHGVSVGSRESFEAMNRAIEAAARH